MAEFKRLPLSSIFVGDRERPIDEEYAQAIAANMIECGLIAPITVRSTPAKNRGKTPFTLVAGGHRYRAAEINGWNEIDVLEIEAESKKSLLVELSENIFRNDLSALDRAMFVLKYREAWEDKHGKISRGGDQKSNRQDDGLIFSAGKALSERVQSQLGFGESSYERVTRIGRNLHPALRTALRGTGAEHDQSKLLKLAKLPTDDQIKIAAALKENPDLKPVLEWLKGPVKDVDPQKKLLITLCTAWEKASEETRQEFLATIGMSNQPDAVMAMIKEAAE